MTKESRIFLANYLGLTLRTMKYPKEYKKKASRLKDKLSRVEASLRLSAKDKEFLANVATSGLNLSEKRLELVKKASWVDKLFKRKKYNELVQGLTRISESHKKAIKELKGAQSAAPKRNKSNTRNKKS